jgi:pimeloyl-ACP methyl ester carboxylesterase
MLAQAVACAQPDRASGLVSLLSTPTPSLRINRPKIWTVLRMIKVMSGKSADRDAEGQRWVDLFRLMATKDYPADDDHWRAAGRLAFDRGRHPVGAMRHSAALRAVGDRRAELATLRIPALVVHGSLDQLISTRAGRATADAIPGARFLLVPGMGHQLARPVWPMVLDEIGGLFAGQAQLSR